MCFATVALIVALFVGPKTIQAQTAYGFQIGDTKVTSDNFNNLTSITGVSGNVKYDPESKTLTLENATIETNEEIPLVTNLPGYGYSAHWKQHPKIKATYGYDEPIRWRYYIYWRWKTYY